MTLAPVEVVRNIRIVMEEKFNYISLSIVQFTQEITIILGVGKMLLQVEEVVNKIGGLKDALIEIRASL